MAILNIVTDGFIIAGVVYAGYIYRKWKDDYKLQKSHEYAIDLLKKIKHLHFGIEFIRRPRFYNEKTIVEDINDKDIPQIEEKILEKVTEIRADLSVAECILVEHKDLLSKFNENINCIIKPINSAVYDFYYKQKEAKENGKPLEVKKTKIFEILYPSEILDPKTNNVHTDYQPDIFLIGKNVVNDEFNKTIVKNFKIIYDCLKENLVDRSSRKKKWWILFSSRIKGLVYSIRDCLTAK